MTFDMFLAQGALMIIGIFLVSAANETRKEMIENGQPTRVPDVMLVIGAACMLPLFVGLWIKAVVG